MPLEKLNILKQLSQQVSDEVKSAREASANIPDLPSESQMRWVAETRAHMGCADHFLEAMNAILNNITPASEDTQ